MKKLKIENELVLEFNKSFKIANTTPVIPGGPLVMITPPLDENYWIFRIKLFKNQAILGFPKFRTIGIGFAQEVDWNCNLPYSSPTERIYKHIENNKKHDEISKEQCIEAIRIVQKASREYMGIKEI